MNKEVFSFIIYMIHELAESWKMLPSRVYHILKEITLAQILLDTEPELFIPENEKTAAETPT